MSPAIGTPTGGQAVEITGTGFRIATAAPGGVVPVPKSPPSMTVTFGGVNAVRVEVISDARLFAFTPARSMPIDSDGTTEGVEVVDVVLENVDDSGVLIGTESVTAASAYTYQRPGISHEDGGDFLRAVRALIDLFRSQVLANTVISTSTDYDPETGLPMIRVEKTPQLILTGPTVEFNSFFTYRGQSEVATADPEEFLIARRHRVVDLNFEVTGVTNSDVELINLQSLFETVVDRNTKIDFECDPDVPALGTFPLELHITKSPDYNRVEKYANSDLRVFTATIMLKGYPLGTLPGVAQDGVQGVTHEVTELPTLEAPLQIGTDIPAVQGAPTRSPPEQAVPSPPKAPPHGASTRSPPEAGAQ